MRVKDAYHLARKTPTKIFHIEAGDLASLYKDAGKNVPADIANEEDSASSIHIRGRELLDLKRLIPDNNDWKPKVQRDDGPAMSR